MGLRSLSTLTLGACLACAAVAHGQTVLRTEPPMGQLRPGQRVLVDNGECPSGQVLEVIGGDHRKVGGKGLLERRKRCIARR